MISSFRIVACLISLVLAVRVPVPAEDKPEALLERGLYLSDLYNWAAARPYLIKAEQQFEASGDKKNSLYAELAVIRAGGEPSSLPEQSYRLAQELTTNPILQSDKELRMYCLAVKGELDGEIDSSAMRRDWSEAKALAHTLGNEKWEYRATGQLGFADFYDGDLPSARKKVAEALIGAVTIKDVGGEIFFLSATATGLVGQGLNEQALQYADRAIALATATPDAGYPIIAEEARLLAMVGTSRIEEARTELKKALAQARSDNSHAELADLNETAATIARRQNDIPAAIAYVMEALRHARIYGGKKVIPQFESELSDLYRISGDLPKAESLASEAATSVQTFGYLPLLPRFLAVLAEIQIDEHKYEEADRTFDRAALIQDAMVGNADSDLGKTALIKGASGLYAKHFALLAEHGGEASKAFAVLEQARGRVLTDLLISGARATPESIAAENKIARLRLKLMTANSNRELLQLRDEIFFAEQSRSITPEISILRSNEYQAITLQQLQQELSPSEVLLEYVIDDPTSYCLIVTRQNSRITSLAGAHIINPAVVEYLTEVRAKRAARAQARKLYQLLLASIPEALTKKQLVVVRDGPLHLVPFDALQNERGHYLVESASVIYSPSATSFVVLRRGSRSQVSNSGVLAVGGVPYDRSGLRQSEVTRGLSGTGLANLPSSEDEARAALEAFPGGPNTLLVGTNATEAAFKKFANHRIIHVAVHGIVNEARPDRAALVFLSDAKNGEDGFLEPSEIVQLSLNADLVVLSACDTAVGPVQGEEGISTLSRAFLLAGARTVVSTLWSIDDDSTLYLMKAFYAELAHGTSAPVALKNAKLKMLRDFGSSNAVPYYWAGFSVEGFARPPLVEN